VQADGSRRAGYAGLATCGSVWACPVCSAKIAARRQEEVEHAARFWESLGGALAFGTFTVAHSPADALADVWGAVSAGWAAVTSGTPWGKNQATFGIEGWTKFVETRYGDNGWHVHVHVLFFLHHGLGQVERAALTAALLGRWRAGIGKHGFAASAQYGADIRMIHGFDSSKVLADYLTKGVYTPDGSAPELAALELTRGDLKQARGGSSSRSPFQILEDLLRWGDVADLELWQEWEKGSHRKRQQNWAKGFRELVGLCSERTDEELAAEELGSSADDVIVLEAGTVAATMYQRHVLLEIVEAGGVKALTDWLDARRLPWLWPTDRLRT
jgi:hypothetical protein